MFNCNVNMGIVRDYRRHFTCIVCCMLCKTPTSASLWEEKFQKMYSLSAAKFARKLFPQGARVNVSLSRMISEPSVLSTEPPGGRVGTKFCSGAATGVHRLPSRRDLALSLPRSARVLYWRSRIPVPFSKCAQVE